MLKKLLDVINFDLKCENGKSYFKFMDKTILCLSEFFAIEKYEK